MATRTPAGTKKGAPAVGVVARHRDNCPARHDGDCVCKPKFQAQVWSPRDKRQIRKTFDRLGDAVAWRQETQVAVRRGSTRAPSPTTIREAATDWIANANAGVVRTRSGH